MSVADSFNLDVTVDLVMKDVEAAKGREMKACETPCRVAARPVGFSLPATPLTFH